MSCYIKTLTIAEISGIANLQNYMQVGAHFDLNVKLKNQERHKNFILGVSGRLRIPLTNGISKVVLAMVDGRIT